MRSWLTFIYYIQCTMELDVFLAWQFIEPCKQLDWDSNEVDAFLGSLVTNCYKLDSLQRYRSSDTNGCLQGLFGFHIVTRLFPSQVALGLLGGGGDGGRVSAFQETNPSDQLVILEHIVLVVES